MTIRFNTAAKMSARAAAVSLVFAPALFAGSALGDVTTEGEVLRSPEIAFVKQLDNGDTFVDGDVRWLFPGQRELSRRVFGPADGVRGPGMIPPLFDMTITDATRLPLGFEDDVGVPLNLRIEDLDMSTEAEFRSAPVVAVPPAGFANIIPSSGLKNDIVQFTGELDDIGGVSRKFAPITGNMLVRFVDRTGELGTIPEDNVEDGQGFMDAPFTKMTTGDEVEGEFVFTSPVDGRRFRLVMKEALPQIPAHPVLGGVGLNFIHHGRTGIGTKLMSRVWTFAAFWAVGDLFVDADGDGLADELPKAGENRFVHFMVTERVRDPRDEFYKITLVGDDNIRDGIHAHLVLPPIQVEITRDAFGEPTKFTFLGPPNNPRPLAALNAPAPFGIGETVVPVPLPEEDPPPGRTELLAGTPAAQIFFHIMWEDITTLAPKARPAQRPSPARDP